MADVAIAQVRGRLDANGRLVEADPELEVLQREAGSAIGDALALPQIAAIARLALELGAEVSRPALAGSASEDIDMWVRAVPGRQGLELLLEDWRPRPAGGARLEPLLSSDALKAGRGLKLEWMADEQLRIIGLSAELAKMLAVDSEGAAGLPLTRLFQLDEDEAGEMPLIAALASRQDFAGQRARSRADGQRIFVLSGHVVIGADGAFAGFRGDVSVAEDAALDESNSSGSDQATFDHALDDVLREPLERIIESAGRIVERSDGPLRGDYASYGSDIAAAARHLSSVIRDMGDGMTGDEAEANRAIELTTVAAEAVVMIEAAAEERSIAIDLAPSQPIRAMGQERAVIQILVNLLGNAVRHSNERGRVSIEFDRSDATASLTVRDFGHGIDPADQQRIFERYEQVEAGGGSAGLGLAISRRLARSMGGDISVESTPGQGAAFILTLPRA